MAHNSTRTPDRQERPGKARGKTIGQRGRPPGDHDAKRAKLLAAGMSVIAKFGYAGASLRKVADSAGYTTGAVTYYFENKEALIAAITEHMFNMFDMSLDPRHGATDIKQGLKLWLEQMGNDSELWLVQFQLLAYARHDPACAAIFQRRCDRYRKDFAEIIAMYQRKGAVRADIAADILADMISAMADGWMMSLPVEPKRFGPKRIELLLDSAMTLLTPPPGISTKDQRKPRRSH